MCTRSPCRCQIIAGDDQRGDTVAAAYRWAGRLRIKIVCCLDIGFAIGGAARKLVNQKKSFFPFVVEMFLRVLKSFRAKNVFEIRF